MDGWPKPGTPIKLVVKTWSGKAEHVGISLPPSGKDLGTMKLQNGYNVSFPESYVEGFELLDGLPDVEEGAFEEIVEQDESLPLVHLIHTGGTIASKVDYSPPPSSSRP